MLHCIQLYCLYSFVQKQKQFYRDNSFNDLYLCISQNISHLLGNSRMEYYSNLKGETGHRGGSQ